MGHGYIVRRGGSAESASKLPEFTYTGAYDLVDDGVGADGKTQNWRIKLLTSGVLNFSNLGSGKDAIDIFLVGGGAGGRGGGSGGGSGYTINGTYPVEINTNYSVIIGAGGGSDTNGGATSFLHYTANGGTQYSDSGGNGGSAGGGAAYGGSTGGTGGSDGSDGIPGSGGDFQRNGKGQGTTTREFGETSGDLYAGGGGGGGRAIPGAGGDGGGGDGSTSGNGGNGVANTGGGGGGGGWDKQGGSGGSGIVVIRNKR